MDMEELTIHRDCAIHFVSEAEGALLEIDKTLLSFDREAIYQTGWYERGDQYWQKLDTRQTTMCYFASRSGYSERRFRREDVEADAISTPWYEGYHLGRFVYNKLIEERQGRADYLERCRQDLQHIDVQLESEIDNLLMPVFGQSSQKVDWKKEGF